jgi:hypothetical protein
LLSSFSIEASVDHRPATKVLASLPAQKKTSRGCDRSTS